MLTVVKFGGSSLAGAKRFEAVRGIVLADPRRRVMIVSAPGKATQGDNKITDLLYLTWAHIRYGVDYRPTLALVEARYRDIARVLGCAWDAGCEFETIRERIDGGCDEDYLVSRGEYLCAKLMASCLGWDFVDAHGTVFFSGDGSIDTDRTYAAIKTAYDISGGRIVMPGFYGTQRGGEIRLMSRGGSDISGAVAAAALDAGLYENWTDVPGLLMADPGIVKNPRPIPRITYNELRELTYMGAKVLHEESVFPVRFKGIPINIRSTAEPNEPGTLICEGFEDDEPDESFITGIAGKRDFSIISIRQSHIAGQLGIVRQVLELFQRHEIGVESMPSGIDGFSLVVSTKAVKPHLYGLIAGIEELCSPGSVTVTEGIALIAAVGRKMVLRPGISGKLFGALGQNGINIRLISQGTDELNITIGVRNEDFNRTIQVLYDSFTGRGDI